MKNLKEEMGRDYNRKNQMKDLKVLQDLQLTLHDLPNYFKDEKYKMYSLHIKLKIAEFKYSLYGEQTQITIQLLEKTKQ